MMIIFARKINQNKLSSILFFSLIIHQLEIIYLWANKLGKSRKISVNKIIFKFQEILCTKHSVLNKLVFWLILKKLMKKIQLLQRVFHKIDLIGIFRKKKQNLFKFKRTSFLQKKKLLNHNVLMKSKILSFKVLIRSQLFRGKKIKMKINQISKVRILILQNNRLKNILAKAQKIKMNLNNKIKLFWIIFKKIFQI